MNLIKIIFLPLIFNQVLSYNCVDYLKQFIRNQVNPYQVTIFSNNSQHYIFRKEEANVIQSLQDFPHVKINFEATTVQNQLLDQELFNDPRYMSFNIILIDKYFYQEKTFKRVIDFLALFSPIQWRQKILLISLDNYSPLDSTLKAVFEYAWSKKFLDFTIIGQNSKFFDLNDCAIQYKNPFKNEIFSEKFGLKTNIFPDKLDNVHGHTLKLAVISADVIVEFIRDPLQKIIDVKADKFYLLTTSFKKMNFTYEIVEAGINMTFFDGSRIVGEKLYRNEINLYAKPTNYFSNSKHVSIDIENDCEKIIAVVPTKSVKTSVHISIEIIISFCFLPLLIAFIRMMVKILRIKHKKWKIFDIIVVFFGRSVNWPLGYIDRIIFMVIVILSSIFSIDFYSGFLNIGLAEKENLFNTFKDIVESNLSLYSFNGYSNDIFTRDDIYGQSMKNKIHGLPDTVPCLEALVLRDDRICFIREGILKGTGKYISNLRNHKFNIAKPVFNCLKNKFSFEKSSPYAEKIFHTFRRIHESGIHRILEPEWKRTIGTSMVGKGKNGEFFFLMSLILILVCGYTASIVLFWFECKKCKIQHNRKRVVY